MLTSAPVSMRKCAPEMVSLTCRRDTFVVGLAALKIVQLEVFRPPWEFPWFGSGIGVLVEDFQSHGVEHFRAFAPNLAW